MSLSNKGSFSIDKKLSSTGKTVRLNPDAAEFVPFALRSPSATVGATYASSSFGNFGTTSPGKAVLDRSESSVSNNSDDEVHQYWRQQLPDDITPDFNVAGDKDSQGINALPFSALSLADVNETSRFTGRFLKDSSPHQTNGSSFSKNMGFPVSSYDENPPSSFQQQLPAKPWDIHGDQLLSGIREESSYNGHHGHGYIDGILNEQQMEDTEVNPLEFLASQFPGFAAESLADVYFANGGDLNLTIEMLTQLELQVDGGFNQNQNLNSKAVSTPNLSALDFPALSPADGQNGDDHQQHINPYHPMGKENLLMFKSSSTTSPSGGATDFASAVRKLASQDSGIWKYNRDPNQDTTIGSSRSSHVLASSYTSGHGRMNYGDRLTNTNRNPSRSAPVWLETGDAVANMYSEMRGEARDHARLRNAYFEQARQAYLVGYKALAKELSVKGQLHNMQMKAAHGKAQESIYRQRNPVSPGMQSNGRGHERIIDLHGLHVTEAIHVLKRDLTMLRNVARSADQHVQVYICVGTGHHTRGTRTPARLPVAVQRYLLEEEGLDYSEPQPGLLRVRLY
ncbi:hypothetical protein L1987_29655 [Smallanthus sonchifolius]|uniref:Uncharacterized protein n=1 Tax=Smallanthus sonchifolius TaxID=185202 RepID=A0ACB9I0H1_9ASTR|nr:hypothetical protein L1987_29655 [Smallanthus sonchifolius]